MFWGFPATAADAAGVIMATIATTADATDAAAAASPATDIVGGGGHCTWSSQLLLLLRSVSACSPTFVA